MTIGPTSRDIGRASLETLVRVPVNAMPSPSLSYSRPVSTSLTISPLLLIREVDAANVSPPAAGAATPDEAVRVSDG
jgi:hypothetical protein